MPQQIVIQTSFAAGMLSPRLRGRTDLAQFAAGAEDLTNVLVQTQGGATKRPGSYYIAAPGDTARVRLYPFIVSSEVAYVLEFGDLALRFFRNRAQLRDGGGAALELVTPWTRAQLRSLKFAQSADVLYVFHPAHQPRKLSRTAAGVFELALAVFLNGPYDAENTGDVGAAVGSPATSSVEADTGGASASGSGTGDGGDTGTGLGSGESGEGGDGGAEAEAGGGESGGGGGPGAETA